MHELTEAHKRALNTLAALTEQKLLEIELTLIKPGFHHPIYLSFVNDLPLEKRDLLRRIISRLKDVLKDFSGAYDIKKEESSVQQEVYTKTVFLWEILCEYTGHRLNNYGQLEDVVINDIDERVNQMIELTVKMQGACKGNS